MTKTRPTTQAYAVSVDGETFYRIENPAWEPTLLTREQVEFVTGDDTARVDSYLVGPCEPFRPEADQTAMLESLACQADDFGEWGEQWVRDQLDPASEDPQAAAELQTALQDVLCRWLSDNGIYPDLFLVRNEQDVPFQA